MALKKFEKKKNPDAGFASAREMSGVAIGSAADLTPERQEMIPVQLIAFHEENDYRNIECGEEDLDRLADAIDKQGFLGSLIVTERPSRDPEQAGKRYVLLSGERRLRAVGRLMQRGDDYKTRFASLPCTVKSGFSADPERRRAEEMLILDSANLNTRGGIGGIKDKKFVTRVRRRYMENLMFLYGMSELEAGKRLKEDSGHADDRSVDRDRQLFAQLVPELYQFIYLEENDLSKNDSIRLSALTPQEQGILLQALRELQQKKQALGEKYDQFFRMLRRDALQQAELPEGPERLQGVKDAAEKAETAVVLQCRPNRTKSLPSPPWWTQRGAKAMWPHWIKRKKPCVSWAKTKRIWPPCASMSKTAPGPKPPCGSSCSRSRISPPSCSRIWRRDKPCPNTRTSRATVWCCAFAATRWSWPCAAAPSATAAAVPPSFPFWCADALHRSTRKPTG